MSSSSISKASARSRIILLSAPDSARGRSKPSATKLKNGWNASGTRLLHREGKAGSDWMLLDFGGLIVHVFTERARHFYDLERLWRAARRIEFKEPREGSSHCPAPRRPRDERAAHGERSQ